MREDEMRVVRRERGQRVILARGNMVVMRANVPPRTQWCFVRRWNGTPRHGRADTDRHLAERRDRPPPNLTQVDD